MAWEYEGLFDAALDPEADDIMSRYWRTEPTAIRFGTMGYRTRTIKAGSRLEAEIYPVFGKQKGEILREAKRNRTPERIREQNISRAKRRLVLLMEENFDCGKDLAITLTYAEDGVTYRRCRQDIRNFLNRVARRRKQMGLEEAKWILAIGHDEQQRIHAHVAMSGGIGRTELERIWGHGYANTYQLQEQGNGLQGFANYMYRQNEQAKRAGKRENMKSWSGSRNLRKPKERVSDSKFSRSRIRKIAYSFGNEAKEITERAYPGYRMEEYKVYCSDIVDGVYIRVTMRKIGEGGRQWLSGGRRSGSGTSGPSTGTRRG